MPAAWLSCAPSMPRPLARVLGGPAADVPVDIGRDEARRAALDELAKPAYQEARPSPLLRAAGWLLDQIDRLLDGAGGAPGGPYGLILIAIVAVVAVLLVLFGVGPFARTSVSQQAVFGATIRSAAEHRTAADAAAAAGDWAMAVRERFRAVVRQLEEDDLIDRRPGRTADEAASEAARLVPALAAELRAGATIFDEVVYGQHPAVATHDQQLRRLDEVVRSAHRSRTSVGAR